MNEYTLFHSVLGFIKAGDIDMYKVLLADDEKLDLEGMVQFIPWEELNMKVIGAVTSGFAAMEFFRREPIDILVTDIRMPNMSGLELAKQALEHQSDLRIIFVSGHQDFSYAKEALSLNAYCYVLKPMDDRELIDSLIKLKQELDRDKKRRETEQAIKQVMTLVQNEYLLQLLEGASDPVMPDVLLDDHVDMTIAWPVQVAVLEIDDLSWKLNPYDDKQKQQMLKDYSSSISSLCQQDKVRHVCKVTKHRIAVLLEQNHDATSILQQWIDHIRVNFPFTMTVGLGPIAVDMTELQQSYERALAALNYKMFDGKGKLIHLSNLRATEMEDIKKMDIRLKTLFDAMNNYELVRIHDEIESLFRMVTSLYSRLTIHNFAMYIILKLDGYLHTLGEDLFILLDMELQNLDILLQFETIDDIRSWLTRKTYEISEALHQKKQKKNWKLISEIERYMRDNLQHTLTLRDVANRFSFSPNHLGYIFKEGTGKSFSEYILELRMEKAKELLKEPKFKIYEVADLVGYRYLPSFSKQFKLSYGMTPVEFKRQN